ncbi:MAG: Tn3 family transposase [Candidatus Tectomicrobia bacterium]
MPVAFLTDEQARRYGRYTGEPTSDQLARFFYLDDADRTLVARRREDYTRLGFAIQLGTVRFLGTFLPDPTDVPAGIVMHMSRQLNISDPSCLPHYLDRSITHYEHAQEIKRRYGYQDFHTHPEYFRLVRWLYTRAWLSAERPSVLFDFTTARLVERKILLPGVTVLARLVARIRDRAATRLWHRLAQLPNADQQAKLVALVHVPDGVRASPLDQLRRAPVRVSGPALIDALQRVDDIRALGVGKLPLEHIPPNRLRALARYGAAARAQAIARMTQERRIATLLAFARAFELIAIDDALDLLDLLISDIIRDAQNDGEKERLRTLRDLDAAALQLWDALQILLDENVHAPAVRTQTYAQIPRERLLEAGAQVEALTRPPDDHYYSELVDRYRRVRRFLPALLRTVSFEGTQAGQPMLDAVEFLRHIEHQRRPDMQQAPLDVVPSAWRRLVKPPRASVVDRQAYTLCAVERLQDHLRRRDVFVPRSERWGDPRVKLLQGEQWDVMRPQVCRALGRSESPEPELHALTQQLDAAYRRTAANFPGNAAVRVEQVKGRDTLTLTGLDKREEPPSLIALRDHVRDLLPRVDLPELLLEIHARTGFANEFTHISEGAARVVDLPISLCAVLLAEACNIGLEPVVRSDHPALTRGRLSWVQQNYLRAETLTRANACLVDMQSTIAVAQEWGGGEVASADGLRFVVPVRTINAGPNRKYFNADRGVTYYNFTSDQFTGFHAIVIPGTLRDSMYILDGLLEHQTRLQPGEIMADTAGVSEVVFGLFWLLGYQFSPRLADIGTAKFWRLDPTADYGVLNGIARARVNTKLITRNWDDLLRVAGSLHQGTVSASELMRSLLRSKRPTTLTRALAALGRIPKTLYMLAYIDDESYRRRILTQLNRGESRHSVARAVFHGQRGELRQRYREGQEDQLGALGLVVNAIVLWNTLYMESALKQLCNEGGAVNPEDVARLSPLIHRHINFQGRYSFALSESVARGELRLLRNPYDFSEDEA